MSGPTLNLVCDADDYVASTGECQAPYYAVAPTSIPELSFEDGLAIAGAIGGVWALGVVARLLIRAQQNAMRD